MKNKRINRFEVSLSLKHLNHIDALQNVSRLNRTEQINQLVQSVTEDDILAHETGKKTVVDVDLSDEAHSHWKVLDAQFGRLASKRKILEIALAKL